MNTASVAAIAEVLKATKPVLNEKATSTDTVVFWSAFDQWCDIVKAMGEQVKIGHTVRTRRQVQDAFYADCGADPTNWRI